MMRPEQHAAQQPEQPEPTFTSLTWSCGLCGHDFPVRRHDRPGDPPGLDRFGLVREELIGIARRHQGVCDGVMA
jgi:hypothetical protein